MNKRRVAVWIHGGIGGGFFSQGQPAIQQLIFRLAEEFEIDVYTLLPPNEDFCPKTFDIFYLNRRIKWKPFRWTYLLAKFFLVCLKNRYHVVYGFWGYPAGTVAVVLGKLLGIPSVVHLQGGDAVRIAALKYGVFYNPLRAMVCRYTYSRCSELITLTHFQEQCLRENKVFRKSTIIPFGVDMAHFIYKEARFNQPFIRFLHVANQTPVKGQELMLQTFSKIARQRASRLSIIGPDYLQGQLRAWCVSLSIENEIEFLGPQPHSKMVHYYHNADILLHTPYYEGQGVVFAEAAACGTLIAGSLVGMLSDMGDACAIAAPPGDPDLLADKIIAALGSKEHLERMQLSARLWAEKRDIDYTERKIVETLNDLLPDAKSEKAPVMPHQIER